MTGEGSDRSGPSSRRDWLRLAGVGAVAIVLSLIGFGVASRFEPSGGPVPPPPVAGDTTSTSSTTPATISPPTTSTEREETTSTTAQPQPGSLALSEESVDFGEDGESVELEVIHTSGAATTWSIASGHPGVSVSPSDGELGSGESVAVIVSLDRTQIEEGEFEANVTLSWDGGEAEARVIAVHEDNPIIHNPTATPSSVEVDGGGDCSPTRTTISARVRDTSELEQVIARWSPDGSDTVETPMSPIGGDVYEASIGPYSAAGTDSVKVVAFDSRDNAGGASISVTIAQCP